LVTEIPNRRGLPLYNTSGGHMVEQIHISEFTVAPIQLGQFWPFLRAPNKSQTMTILGAGLQSKPLSPRTNLIRVLADRACFISIGANPTNDPKTAIPLVPGVPELFAVSPRDRISVISR
jgi:hypothetical protein